MQFPLPTCPAHCDYTLKKISLARGAVSRAREQTHLEMEQVKRKCAGSVKHLTRRPSQQIQTTVQMSPPKLHSAAQRRLVSHSNVHLPSTRKLYSERLTPASYPSSSSSTSLPSLTASTSPTPSPSVYPKICTSKATSPMSPSPSSSFPMSSSRFLPTSS